MGPDNFINHSISAHFDKCRRNNMNQITNNLGAAIFIQSFNYHLSIHDIIINEIDNKEIKNEL